MDIEKRRERNRKYQRRWYATHKELQGSRSRAINLKHLEWFKQYKTTLRCEHCGESRPATLDFHHHNGDKEVNIASVARQWSKKRLLTEIAKCVVVCANCHRQEHYGKYYENL